MNPQIFSSGDFAKALASDTLKQPITLFGMAKKGDHANTIQFSPGSSRGDWVSIPIDRIEKVEWLGKVPCKDHVHELVRLFMKGDDGFYADLFRAYVSQARTPGIAGPVDQPFVLVNNLLANPVGPSGQPVAKQISPSPCAPPYRNFPQMAPVSVPGYLSETSVAPWSPGMICSIPGLAGPYFCNNVNSSFTCAATCQSHGYRCFGQYSNCCPSNKPWGCYCSNNCAQPGRAAAFTNYVATCTFYCDAGDDQTYSITTSGSGTSPAEARTDAENNAVLQGCSIVGYGDCTITP